MSVYVLTNAKQTCAKIGYTEWRLSRRRQAARLKNPELQIDFFAIYPDATLDDEQRAIYCLWHVMHDAGICPWQRGAHGEWFAVRPQVCVYMLELCWRLELIREIPVDEIFAHWVPMAEPLDAEVEQFLNKIVARKVAQPRELSARDIAAVDAATHGGYLARACAENREVRHVER